MKKMKCPICHQLESSSEIKACRNAKWWAKSQTLSLEKQIYAVRRLVNQACFAEEQALFDDPDKLSESEDYDYL